MIIEFYLMALLFEIVTGGDLLGITNSGVGHGLTEVVITDKIYADGVGTAVVGIACGPPNIRFSHKVGLFVMIGFM